MNRQIYFRHQGHFSEMEVLQGQATFEKNIFLSLQDLSGAGVDRTETVQRCLWLALVSQVSQKRPDAMGMFEGWPARTKGWDWWLWVSQRAGSLSSGETEWGQIGGI